MSDVRYDPRQDKDPKYNQEPGLAVVPGSNFQREMARFEQFPDSRWAMGHPGNPYVYRPFPKMLYQARRHKSGALVCEAPRPDPYGDWRDPNHYQRALEEADRFNESCQRTVSDERELQAAMEAGWRESHQEAMAFADARERAIADAAAHRNYEDRNLSEAAQREVRAEMAETDGHFAEMPSASERKRSADRRRVR